MESVDPHKNPTTKTTSVFVLSSGAYLANRILEHRYYIGGFNNVQFWHPQQEPTKSCGVPLVIIAIIFIFFRRHVVKSCDSNPLPRPWGGLSGPFNVANHFILELPYSIHVCRGFSMSVWRPRSGTKARPFRWVFRLFPEGLSTIQATASHKPRPWGGTITRPFRRLFPIISGGCVDHSGDINPIASTDKSCGGAVQ